MPEAYSLNPEDRERAQIVRAAHEEGGGEAAIAAMVEMLASSLVPIIKELIESGAFPFDDDEEASTPDGYCPHRSYGDIAKRCSKCR